MDSANGKRLLEIQGEVLLIIFVILLMISIIRGTTKATKDGIPFGKVFILVYGEPFYRGLGNGFE